MPNAHLLCAGDGGGDSIAADTGHTLPPHHHNPLCVQTQNPINLPIRPSYTENYFAAADCTPNLLCTGGSMPYPLDEEGRYIQRVNPSLVDAESIRFLKRGSYKRRD